jgi:SAM-dependent methyltransferase
MIRHLPSVMGSGCEFFGTDYNKRSIEWCTQNLPGISFNNNSLEARLPYADNFFDVVYGISIFTHLSESMHFAWYNELSRVLKPGGLFFLTTQGDNFKCKLMEPELADYNKGQLIVRGKVKEGHRTFSAFHPKSFMLKLFANAEIVEHIETPPQSTQWIPQDIWMVRKR